MRADRLIGLILILQGRGKTRGEVLARELEVSRRTILRDVEALSSAGVPILAEGGPGGGIWLDEAYRTSLTGLGESELRALILGADASLAEDLGMGEAYRLGRGKLIAAQPTSFEPVLEMVQRRILVDSRWWWREAGAESFLAPLQEAVFMDALVEAEYQHFDGSVRNGLLEPYGLVAKAGLWYLVGRREGEYRSYRVSRFLALAPAGRSFARDPGFDLREWWPQNAERFAAEFSAFRFKLSIPEGRLGFVKWIAPGRASVQGPSSARTGWIDVEVGVESSLFAELIVLGLVPDCEVLEPASLAEAVAARALSALAGNGRGGPADSRSARC